MSPLAGQTQPTVENGRIYEQYALFERDDKPVIKQNSRLEQDCFYIDGEWQKPVEPASLTVICPTTELPIGHAPSAGPADVDAAVRAARRAFDFGEWPKMLREDRIAVLETTMAYLTERVDEIAGVVTDEMGAPIWMRGHFDWALSYWADIRDSYRAHALDSRRSHGQGDTLVVRAPVGVVAAIVPWNAPLLLAIEKVASALITGCTCVLKPAPQTPLDAYFLAKAFEAASLPAGVFNLIQGDRSAGEYLVSHPGVDKVSLTGSTAAGRRVGSICGGEFRRASLELGGKSAAVILDDADIKTVASALRWGNFISSGQACNLLSRVLVPHSRVEEVIDAIAVNARGLKVGDPRDVKTELGPLVSKVQRDRVEAYIAGAKTQGARLVCGGGRPAHLERGWFVEPTVFADVAPAMTIAREEVFGPVVSIMTFDNDAEALRIANDSEYGLGGAVFSNDIDRAIAFARGLQAGSVSINRYGSAPNAPFGGYKSSGVGREHGPEGIEEYLTVKSIALPLAG